VNPIRSHSELCSEKRQGNLAFMQGGEKVTFERKKRGGVVVGGGSARYSRDERREIYGHGGRQNKASEGGCWLSKNSSLTSPHLKGLYRKPGENCPRKKRGMHPSNDGKLGKVFCANEFKNGEENLKWERKVARRLGGERGEKCVQSKGNWLYH